jgi:hypothetical protein
MALTKTVTTNQGFKAIDAYHRVEGIRIISKNKIEFQLRSYKDDANFPHFEYKSFDCEYNLLGDNPIKQAYSYLKTLPEFADATDC